MRPIYLEEGVKAVAVPVRGVRVEDPASFMAGLRAEASGVVLQALDARYVADAAHLWAAVRQAWAASKSGVSRVQFDLDIILRISCDSRLDSALETVGVKKSVMDVIFVAVGREDLLKRVVERLSRLGSVSDTLLQLTAGKERFLRRRHSVSELTLQSTTLKEEQLAYVLAEKAAVALSGRR